VIIVVPSIDQMSLFMGRKAAPPSKSSLFTQIFATAAAPDEVCDNLRSSYVTGEQSYIKASARFFATGLRGARGPFAVLPLGKAGKCEADMPIVAGHTAPVLDFDFNPFDDCLLASASEDQTVKVWRIPEEGLTATMNEPVADLRGHDKKVILLRFHPTASNVLASVSADQTVKVWDIEKHREVFHLPSGTHEEPIHDIVWDHVGKTYITASRDKLVRIVDVRASAVATTINSVHDGPKSIKLAYTGASNRLVSVGSTNFLNQRQFKLWDPRNMSKELRKVDIDQATHVIMPFYDQDTNLLYLIGKGDTNVRVYEVSPGGTAAPGTSTGTSSNGAAGGVDARLLCEYTSTVATKGAAWVPKRALDVMGREVGRVLKLTTNSVEPLSFHVPRKSAHFQADLFPFTASNVAALTADEWVGGANKPPKLLCLNPEIKGKKAAVEGAEGDGDDGDGSGAGAESSQAMDTSTSASDGSAIDFAGGGMQHQYSFDEIKSKKCCF
jgi:coronin-1B/1C/6